MEKGGRNVTETEIRQIVRQALSNVAPEVDLASIDPKKDLRDQIDIDSVDFLNLDFVRKLREGIIF
jgi:hypothetical protein